MSVESDAIAALTSDPETFLRSFRVRIQGFSTRPASNTVFTIRWGSDPYGPTWRIAPAPNPDPGPGRDIAANEFVAFYVPMLQVSEYSHAVLPGGGDVDFMLTSFLDGCTFGVCKAGGSTYATHIQPNKDVKSGALPELVAGHLPGVHTAGRGTGYEFGATVVGKRDGGDWQVFVQRHDTYQVGQDVRVKLGAVERL